MSSHSLWNANVLFLPFQSLSQIVMDDDCPTAIFPSKPCKWLLFYLRNKESMKELFNSIFSFHNGWNWGQESCCDWPTIPEVIRKEAKAKAQCPDTGQGYFHWTCVHSGVLLHNTHRKRLKIDFSKTNQINYLVLYELT